MKIKRDILAATISLVFIVIILAGSVSAFAISAPYMEDRKLYLLPGQSENLTFVLQNEIPDEGSILITPNIISGGEIFKITDENKIYEIPGGERTDVNAQVIIPKDANENYQVVIDFVGSKLGGTGFGFGTSIKHSFFVILDDSPQIKTAKTESRNELIKTILLPLALILILIGAVYMIRKRKTKDNAGQISGEEE